MEYSISDVFSTMTEVYQLILSMFSNVIDTITGNPLLYVPVLIALFAGALSFAVTIVRKFGVRGVSSGSKGGKR